MAVGLEGRTASGPAQTAVCALYALLGAGATAAVLRLLPDPKNAPLFVALIAVAGVCSAAISAWCPPLDPRYRTAAVVIMAAYLVVATALAWFANALSSGTRPELYSFGVAPILAIGCSVYSARAALLVTAGLCLVALVLALALGLE